MNYALVGVIGIWLGMSFSYYLSKRYDPRPLLDKALAGWRDCLEHLARVAAKNVQLQQEIDALKAEKK